MTIPVFLINLSSRFDRLEHAQREAARVGVGFIRVSAMEASDVEEDVLEVTQLEAGRIACWASHRHAWQLGSNGAHPYFLVLEDDVRWLRDPRPILNVLAGLSGSEFDVLQLGSLQHGPTRVPARAVAAHRLAKIVRTGRLVNRRMGVVEDWLVSRSQLMSQSMREDKALTSLSGQVLWGSFGSGTHAYAVSKRMAHHLLTFNWPPFLAADDALDVLARQHTFLIGELISSLAVQAPMSSDLR